MGCVRQSSSRNRNRRAARILTWGSARANAAAVNDVDDARHNRGGLTVVLGLALLIAAGGVALGPIRYVRQGGGPWVHILPLTFSFWEQHPVREHWFLSFFDADALARGRAYPHYTAPWLWLLYVLLQPAHWAGASYEVAQPWLCLPQFAVIVLLLGAHLRHIGPVPWTALISVAHVRLAAIVLAVACVMTLPSFWVPFFRFNPEQIWFVPALACCHLAAADSRRAIGRWSDWTALIAIALFAPMFAPFALAAWILLWTVEVESVRARRRQLVSLALIGGLAALTFLLPGRLLHVAGFAPGGSSFWYRSGLDGSPQYFSSMIQAIAAPSFPRPWQLLQWPVIALVAVAGAAFRSPVAATRMLRQLLICWLPTLWTLTVVPQMVSIHPYSFDFSIALGSAFSLAFWLQLEPLALWQRSGTLRLAVVIVLSGLLMTNLLDLARMVR